MIHRHEPRVNNLRVQRKKCHRVHSPEQRCRALRQKSGSREPSLLSSTLYDFGVKELQLVLGQVSDLLQNKEHPSRHVFVPPLSFC